MRAGVKGAPHRAFTGSRVGRAATRLSSVYRRGHTYPRPAGRRNQFLVGGAASILDLPFRISS